MRRVTRIVNYMLGDHLLVLSGITGLLLTTCTVLATATVPIAQTFGVEQLKDIEARAEKGDADAAAQLADGYMHGVSPLNPDEDKAYKWLVKAANGGVAWAETNLGSLYEKGRHVEKDYPMAMKWYLRAADQQYPDAEDLLGKMYRDGRGVEKNYPQAAEWFKKAVDQLSIQAADDLAALYAEGGAKFPKDYETAYFWFYMPTNDAWPEPGFKNTLIYEDHRPLFKDAMNHLTPEQTSAIQKRVQEWVPPPKTKWTPKDGHLHFTLPPGGKCINATTGASCPSVQGQ